jgi:hypothetical protein
MTTFPVGVLIMSLPNGRRGSVASDAANYAITLFVVTMALPYRALSALAKGITMGLFGLWVIGTVLWHAWHGTLAPQQNLLDFRNGPQPDSCSATNTFLFDHLVGAH